MSLRTHIEWTESTWNPVTGCTKISEGCANCYAERLAKRLRAMGNRNYRNGFEVTLHPAALAIPSRWKKPQLIFVNSMSDLFHEDIDDAFIRKVFDVMIKTDRHVYQILTKRSERLLELAPSLPWAEHIWMGVTVESRAHKSRIAHLRKTPAHTKFLSLEPLLGPVPGLNLKGIDWVIVGGESGVGARPMKEEWAIDIRNQCDASGTPFFFKQWGGVNKKKAGRLLEGKLHSEMPSSLKAYALLPS